MYPTDIVDFTKYHPSYKQKESPWYVLSANSPCPLCLPQLSANFAYLQLKWSTSTSRFAVDTSGGFHCLKIEQCQVKWLVQSDCKRVEQKFKSSAFSSPRSWSEFSWPNSPNLSVHVYKEEKGTYLYEVESRIFICLSEHHFLEYIQINTYGSLVVHTNCLAIM